ncbi:RDD family protein [Pseudarthrobacter sp. NPDC055928]|uniref:RDD family protein n=1 Tax=Pseudarthrobacter sp. NPDC055928 TaxID=3345661 RepID=UPI0035E067E7
MTQDSERCQRCQQLIRAGATFCTACGAPLPNRAARNARYVDHAQQALMERAAEHAAAIPGTIPVVQRVPADSGPGMAQAVHGQGGGTGMAVNLGLVPAASGKRLGAAVLDWLAPLVVLGVTFAIGFAGVTRTQSGGFIIYDTGSLVLFGGIGLGLTLVYIVVLLGLEGRSGITIGNRLMGIRSADNDGYAPGGGAVFLRGLVTGAGVLLAVVAAAALVIFKWFDAALFILAPLVLAGAAWAVLVVVSNSWDKNGKLRGWHDTAAKTLVFDVKAGRNPIATGGIQGPYSFAPLDLPPVQQVASPVAGAAKAPQVINAQAPLNPNQWQPPAGQPASQAPRAAVHPEPAPMAQAVPPAPATPQGPAAQPAAQLPYAAPQAFAPQPFTPPAPAAAPVPPGTHGTAGTPGQPAAPIPPAHPAPREHSAPGQAPAAAHPDDDHDRTQMRGGFREVAPVAVLRIRLDDGRDFQLDRNVLVGRNPVGQAGEQQAQLLAVDDPGRSISKTHLHVLSDGAGVWVTDRNSTNGSAVTTPDGLRTPLKPGVPAFVSPGSTVHFGDRSFHLGQA